MEIVTPLVPDRAKIFLKMSKTKIYPFNMGHLFLNFKFDIVE